MNNVVKLYTNYFDSYEETYDEGDLNEKGATSNDLKLLAWAIISYQNS